MPSKSSQTGFVHGDFLRNSPGVQTPDSWSCWIDLVEILAASHAVVEGRLNGVVDGSGEWWWAEFRKKSLPFGRSPGDRAKGWLSCCLCVRQRKGYEQNTRNCIYGL